MIADVEAFVAYFRGVHRRTVRDVSALPAAAAEWRPGGEGEMAWSVRELVGHVASLRAFFVAAYRGEGWRIDEPPAVPSLADGLAALEASMKAVETGLAGTPAAWLTRRVELMDEPGSIAGWRVLMMMVEHEIHHRSQIDTYAGLNRWELPQLFGRAWEELPRREP